MTGSGGIEQDNKTEQEGYIPGGLLACFEQRKETGENNSGLDKTGMQMGSRQHWLRPAESGKCTSSKHPGHWSYCEQSERVSKIPGEDPSGKRYSEDDGRSGSFGPLTR